mgnify:CR=1 FL=1
MPCEECENGKVKWGKTGNCEYDSIAECEAANKDYYEKTTSIVELVIDEDSEELAIDAISLVSAPAIEQDFVYFGKEKNNLTFAKVDEEKRMLVSPALIPNKQIFRYNPNTDVWQEIKQGNLKGLSIEGYFTDKMEKMSEKTPTDEEILSALNEIINENQTK